MKTTYFVVLSSLVVLSATPAAASVACQGDFQKVEGNWIATPLCSDHHIARFADGEEGYHVTTREVENRSLLKSEICDGNIGLETSCGEGGDDQ
jgi:hypothetical protein